MEKAKQKVSYRRRQTRLLQVYSENAECEGREGMEIDPRSFDDNSKMASVHVQELTARREAARAKVCALALEVLERELAGREGIPYDQLTLGPKCDFESFTQFLHGTRDICDEQKTRQRKGEKLREFLAATVNTARLYAPVVDVFIQQQPQITALVWGSLRLMIETAARSLKFRENLCTAVETVFRQVKRISRSVENLALNDEALSAVARWLAQIIVLLMFTNSLLSGPKASASRRLKAAVTDRLGTMLRNIEIAEQEVDRQGMSLEISDQQQFRAETRDDNLAFQSMTSRKLLDIERALGQHQDSNREKYSQYFHILNWLEIEGLSHIAVSEPEPGTCNWIESHPKFQSWVANNGNQPFWIRGRPGSGKSCLSQYLLQLHRVKLKTGFHIVFEPSTASRTGPKHAIIKLLKDVCHIPQIETSPYFGRILQLISRWRTSTSMSIPEILEHVVKPILDMIPPFILIADGLEIHAQEEDFKPILRFLIKLAGEPRVTVVLVSTDLPELQECLKHSSQIKLDANLLNDSIRRYCCIRSQRETELERLSQVDLEKIIRHSQGLFLCAKLMLDALKSSNTKEESRDIIEHFPKSLMEMYQRQHDEIIQPLSDKPRQSRLKILSMLSEAAGPLTVDIIAEALALDLEHNITDPDKLFYDREKSIRDLCGDLLQVENKIVRFYHASGRKFVVEKLVKTSDSIEYLLRICLSEMSKEKYQESDFLGKLLWDNLLPERKMEVKVEKSLELLKDRDTPLYDHACQNWYKYTVKMRQIPSDIEDKLQSFLSGPELVAWSEALFKLQNKSLDAHVDASAQLLAWYRSFDSSSRPSLPIDNFLIRPFEKLSIDFSRLPTDPLWPTLPFMRLASFLFLAGKSVFDYQQANQYKRKIADNFLEILGEDDHLTIQAQRDVLQDELWQNRPDKALEGLYPLLEKQREIIGEDSSDFVFTMLCIANGLFYTTQFEEAKQLFQDTSNRYEQLLGSKSLLYFASRLWICWTIEQLGDLRTARAALEELYDAYTPKFGKETPFETSLLASIGAVARKEGNFARAERVLLDAYRIRLEQFTMSNPMTLDSALQLAILWRESENSERCLGILDSISEAEAFQDDFERQCQYTHIKALVAFDRGDFEVPKNWLMDKVMQSTGQNREKNNRELLWVRINLADALRRHGEEPIALMLFSELITSTSDSPSPTPDGPSRLSYGYNNIESPAQMRLAEQALRLVRDAKIDDADELLRLEGYKWVRPKDFWIIFGGPKADTATLRLRPLD